jgi:hypothetical protein
LSVLAGLFLSLFLGGAQMGLAYDELFHIPAGYTFVDTGVRRSTTEHTPLGHVLSGLALTFIEPAYSRSDYLHADFSGAAFEFGFRFFRENEPTLGTLLAVARLPLQLAAVVGAAYVYLLGRSLFGTVAGLTSLVLLATCPLYVGWSRYVYLDGLLAAAMIAALAHLIWFLRRPSAPRAVALGVALGATLSAKYSGAWLPPLAALLICLPPVTFGAKQRALPERLRDAAVVLFVAALCTWVLFGCPRDPLFYLRGYERIYTSAIRGYRFYLFGSFRESFWYFYPALFAVKSTLPTLLGTAAALFLVTSSHRGSVREFAPVVVLLGAASAFLLLTSCKALPIGARYLAPMYPPLYVCIGWVVTRIVASGRAWPMALAGLCLAHHVGTSVRNFPDEMAYFNELVGGSSRGIHVSNDASLYAGQNLPRLARYLRQRGNPPIKIRYQGTDDPSRYGLRSVPMSQGEWDGRRAPGLYAVSSYALVYGMLEAKHRPEHLDWLTSLTPSAIIGQSIYVYEVRPESSNEP